MEPEGRMNVQIVCKFCNGLPFREMRGICQNSPDAVQTAVLQDFREGILKAAVRQMGMGVVERKHNLPLRGLKILKHKALKQRD